VDSLIFRTTGRQRRNLLIGAVLLTGVAAPVDAAVAASHAHLSGQALTYLIALGVAALIYLYACVAYAAARTECALTGIRTWGLGGRRSCPWAEVADIFPRRSHRTSIVVVATTGGRHFWLGAPVDGGIMPDPEFAAKIGQIRDYWNRAVTINPPEGLTTLEWLRGSGLGPGVRAAADAGPGPWLKFLLAITRLPVLLSLALVFVIVVLPFTLRDIGPAWSAHLGHGQPGIFTADTETCSKTCSWYGTFISDTGYTRPDVLFGSGNHISHAGDQAAAIDTGDSKVVYPAGGGTDWILLTGLLAAEIATMIGVPIYLFRKLRRWQARHTPPLADERPGHHTRLPARSVRTRLGRPAAQIGGYLKPVCGKPGWHGSLASLTCS
jgi:hypothetical protein